MKQIVDFSKGVKTEKEQQAKAVKYLKDYLGTKMFNKIKNICLNNFEHSYFISYYDLSFSFGFVGVEGYAIETLMKDLGLWHRVIDYPIWEKYNPTSKDKSIKFVHDFQIAELAVQTMYVFFGDGKVHVTELEDMMILALGYGRIEANLLLTYAGEGPLHQGNHIRALLNWAQEKSDKKPINFQLNWNYPQRSSDHMATLAWAEVKFQERLKELRQK